MSTYHVDFTEYYREIQKDSSSYPDKLKEVLNGDAPEKIYLMGNMGLLDKMGVAICGSRKASETSLETLTHYTKKLIEEDLVIISGYASGVDHVAHYHALENGGETIIVLPEGIKHFKIKRSIEDVWDPERVLVISQFEPNAIWKGWRAMQRNLVVVGLSNAVLLVEPGERGGTQDAGKQALKHHLPLYVADFKDNINNTGHDELIKHGAKEIFQLDQIANLIRDAKKQIRTDPQFELTLRA